MHILIALAGSLEKGVYINSLLKEDYSLVIAVDGGFSHCLALGLHPNVLIGDFDSISPETFILAKEMDVPIKKFPSKKDLTDSELAFELAIEKGATFISVLGALGGRRSDHFLANIFLFNQFYKKVRFQIIDGCQRISLLLGQESFLIRGEEGDLISILPFGGNLKGLEGEGFLYSINNLSIREGFSIGMSNQLMAKEAKIYLREGKAIIIQSRKELI